MTVRLTSFALNRIAVFSGFSTMIVEFSNLVNRNMLWLNSMGSSSTEKSDVRIFVVRFFMFQTFVTEKRSSISAVSIFSMGMIQVPNNRLDWAIAIWKECMKGQICYNKVTYRILMLDSINRMNLHIFF
jgi:hypothetical protein